MTAVFVLDSSVTMSWCFPDEASPASSALLDRLETQVALVPSLWFLEVGNVLAGAERRGRLSTAKSAEFLGRLQTLDVEVDDEGPRRTFAHLLPLCRAHALTTYDAAFLELAIRRQLPLATLDKGLRLAAETLGLRLLGR